MANQHDDQAQSRLHGQEEHDAEALAPRSREPLRQRVARKLNPLNWAAFVILFVACIVVALRHS